MEATLGPTSAVAKHPGHGNRPIATVGRPMSDAHRTTPPSSPAALFMGFLHVGLLGFGGVLPWARLMIVERRRWLTPAEFTDQLAFCQFLPGPNICNMTIALGRRFHGLPGAAAGIAGLMAAPTAIAIVLGALYGRYGGQPVVAHGVAGLAAAGSGLILATSIKIGLPLRGRGLGMALAAITVLAIAVLKLPLVPTMLVLAPVSAWLHRSRV